MKSLLIVGTGDRRYREYLLRSIGTHYRVHLLVGREPTWEREFVAGWSVLDMSDTIDASAMLAAAPKTVDGVLTWDEARVLQAAKLADALGVPGDVDAVMRCRDKHLTRKALADAGVGPVRSVLVSGVEEALAAAERIGYPVVLKPRAMAASLGVVRVDTPAELTARFAFARDTTVPGAWRYDVSVLVEELLTGAEISVDSVVHHGEVRPMFVARKQVGYPPYFEETGHTVSATDPLLNDPVLLTALRETHAALGFTDGATHAEFKLTPSGPRLVEVNGRLGGGMIPYLGMRVTGIDPGLAIAAAACGDAPSLTPSESKAGAVRFFYPSEEDTVIGSVTAELPPEIDMFLPLAGNGEVMSPPPKGTAFGRIALATALAPTVEECTRALDTVEASLTVEPGTVRQPL